MTPWKDMISRRPAFKPDSESEGRRNDWSEDTPGEDLPMERRGGGHPASADLEGPPLRAHEPSSAEERWLGTYLRRAYDDVVAEPLPNSFDDLLRRLQDDEGEALAASSISVPTDSRSVT